MKKLISIICLVQIGLVSGSFAQPYEPLVRENAHWVVADLDDWPVWHNVDIREYYTDDDTLIGDTLYKKVYSYHLESSDFLGIPPYTRVGDPTLYGLLREDTLARIVYGLVFNANPDYCFYTEDTLFDFSLSQNDTIKLCQAWSPILIDTIYQANIFGYNRKCFHLDDLYWGILTEGIGSSFGLYEAWGFAFKKDVLGSELKCYTIGDISNCDILTQTKEEFVPDIKVFPNPIVGEYLYVQLPPGNGQNVTVLVSDVCGKTLSESSLSGNLNKIGLGRLDKGIYFIKVLKENKLLLNKKILKM